MYVVPRKISGNIYVCARVSRCDANNPHFSIFKYTQTILFLHLSAIPSLNDSKLANFLLLMNNI